MSNETVVIKSYGNTPLERIKSVIERTFLLNMRHPDGGLGQQACRDEIYTSRIRAISVSGEVDHNDHIAASLLEVFLDSSARLGIEAPSISATFFAGHDAETPREIMVTFAGPEHYHGQMETSMTRALELISDIENVKADVCITISKNEGQRHWQFELGAEIFD